MPNLSTNISGYGAVTAESIVVANRIEAAGFDASSNGSAATPAFKLPGGNGLYLNAADNPRISAGNTAVVSISTSQLQSLLSFAVSGATNLGGGSMYMFTISPAQITSNQDNYAGFTGLFNRVSTDASRDITGMTAGVTSGQIRWIANVGSSDLVFKNDVTSTEANRFLTATGGDYTLTPGDIAVCIYDSVSARWRVGRMS